MVLQGGEGWEGREARVWSGRHSKAAEVEGSGARGLSSPGTSVGLRALVGLPEKDGRSSSARRLV